MKEMIVRVPGLNPELVKLAEAEQALWSEQLGLLSWQITLYKEFIIYSQRGNWLPHNCRIDGMEMYGLLLIMPRGDNLFSDNDITHFCGIFNNTAQTLVLVRTGDGLKRKAKPNRLINKLFLDPQIVVNEILGGSFLVFAYKDTGENPKTIDGVPVPDGSAIVAINRKIGDTYIYEDITQNDSTRLLAMLHNKEKIIGCFMRNEMCLKVEMYGTNIEVMDLLGATYKNSSDFDERVFIFNFENYRFFTLRDSGDGNPFFVIKIDEEAGLNEPGEPTPLPVTEKDLTHIRNLTQQRYFMGTVLSELRKEC